MVDQPEDQRRSSAKSPDSAGDSADRKPLLQRLVLMGLVLEMGFTVLALLVLGFYLDSHYGTGPWLLMTGVGLGLINMIATMVRIGRRLER